MGRFAHLLRRDAVGGGGCAVPQSVATTSATVVEPTGVQSGDRQGPSDTAPPAGVEIRLQPGLATQQLFQQLEPVSEPLVDLQVLNDESLDDAQQAPVEKGDENDFFRSTLAAAANPGDADDVEADLICPFPRSAAGLPFDIGVGQMQSIFQRATDFSRASDCSDGENESASDTSSNADSASVAGSMEEGEPEVCASTSSAAVPVPTVLLTSPWTKPCKARILRAAIPVLDVSSVRETTPPLDTPGRQVDRELDQELAYIKRAMESSERLLHKSGDNKKSKIATMQGNTMGPPRADVHPENAGTVGLLMWMTKRKELVITGFEKGTQAESCGLILGDAIVVVDGQNVEGWLPEQVTEKLAGPLGTAISLCVSRIYINYKTLHNFMLVRDVDKGRQVAEAKSSQPRTPPVAAPSAKETAGNSPMDPIILSFHKDAARPVRSAAPPVSAIENSRDAVQNASGERRASPPVKSAGLSSSRVDLGNETARGLVPPWSGGSGRAAFLPSPRAGSTNLHDAQAPSVLPLPATVTPPQLRLRQPLGQIQIQDNRHVAAKASPIANLQVSSPGIHINSSAILCHSRKKSRSPEANPSPKMDTILSVTPRKGLGKAPPSGAKPRRIKGDWATHSENQPPNDAQKPRSFKIVKAAPAIETAPENPTPPPSTTRAPLLCVRNVGIMAQPHIIDHTRLHLDVFAETPIVATLPAPVKHATVGVQTGVDCDVPDEISYEEDAVSDLEVFAISRARQREAFSSRKRIFATQESMQVKCSQPKVPQTAELCVPLRPSAAADARNSSRGSRGSVGDGVSKWKYPMSIHKPMQAPKLFSKSTSRGVFSSFVASKPEPWGQAGDFTVEELLSSTISELEVGC